MPTDGLFSPIVTTAELDAATGDQAWLAAMLIAEAALVRAQAAVGIMPAEAAEAVSAACLRDSFRIDQLGRAARAGGNPVIPLVARLRELVPEAHRDWVHWGATSQDILDTAAVLVAVRSGRMILEHLRRLGDALAGLADRHRDTVMTGRTLLQPALPITFGFKAAGWLAGLTDARQAYTEALSGLSPQLGGAAGTLASMGPGGRDLVAAFAAELGLPEPVMPWPSARQRMALLAGSLALLATTAAKISGDVALLMQAEVAEVAEPAAPGRGGSSTLPQKRNPVGAAAVGAAARRATALVGIFYEAVAGEHERSLAAWPAEWQSLGDLIALAGGAVARTAETVEGLEVDAEAMVARVHDLGGGLLAERVSLALADRMGRDPARQAVADALAAAEGTDAGSLLAAFERAHPGVLDPAEAAELADPAGYLGAASVWIDRALAAYRGWAW